MAREPIELDDNPELDEAFFAKARPAREVMSEETQANFRRRGPGKKPAKQQVTLRLDPRVIAHFKGDNPEGWQQRLNAELEKVVSGHSS